MAPTQPERAQEKPQPSAANYVVWGSLATSAVLVTAGVIGFGMTGRGVFWVAQTTPTRPPAPIVVQIPQSTPEFEMARLNDMIRAMAAERELLTAKVEQLEKDIGDITASISTIKQRPASPTQDMVSQNSTNPVSTTQHSPVALAPATAPTLIPALQSESLANPGPSALLPESIQARPGQIQVRPPAAKTIAEPKSNQTRQSAQVPVTVPNLPATQVLQIIPQIGSAPENPAQAASATDSTAIKTEFGIDLGGETSMDSLRARWANIKGNHEAILDNMRPLISVREGQRPGTVELRLVAGPVSDAEAAARVCANLQAMGIACQTTEYDGQKLSLR